MKRINWLNCISFSFSVVFFIVLIETSDAFPSRCWYNFNILSSFSFMSFLAIFVHELGHFVGAIISGQKIFFINIGLGPQLLELKIKNIRITIRMLPFIGVIAYAPQHDEKKVVLKYAFSILMGPMFNVLAALLTLAFSGKHLLSLFGDGWFTGIAFVGIRSAKDL